MTESLSSNSSVRLDTDDSLEREWAAYEAQDTRRTMETAKLESEGSVGPVAPRLKVEAFY